MTLRPLGISEIMLNLRNYSYHLGGLTQANGWNAFFVYTRSVPFGAEDVFVAYKRLTKYIMIKNKINQELYLSPKVNVVEIKAGQMLCGSPTSDEKYGSDMDGGEDLNF